MTRSQEVWRVCGHGRRVGYCWLCDLGYSPAVYWELRRALRRRPTPDRRHHMAELKPLQLEHRPDSTGAPT